MEPEGRPQVTHVPVKLTHPPRVKVVRVEMGQQDIVDLVEGHAVLDQQATGPAWPSTRSTMSC